MSLLDLTIREADLQALRGFILREDGIEAAAYVLCGESHIQCDPWERRRRHRLTVHTVLPVPCEDAISASEQHVSWSTASYVKLLKQAKDEGLVPGIVHIHPRGPAQFSDQDDRNERDLFQLARNRNGEQAKLVSILLTGDGQVRARLWTDVHGPAMHRWFVALASGLPFILRRRILPTPIFSRAKRSSSALRSMHG